MSDSVRDAEFLRECLGNYQRALDAEMTPALTELTRLMQASKARGGKVIFAGNGASSAIASHVAVDFTKTAGVRAVTFHDVDLITCFANDYGYEQWVARSLEAYADAGDLVVLISSSGQSPNMVRAAEYARGHQLTLVTLTGFSPDNPLRQMGDLSLWLDSRLYNVVESVHQIWLLMVCDLLAAANQPSAGGSSEPTA